MAYVVLARKYRPQTLDDLAGQDAIATTLKNAITSDRLSHALLLCGPRGVGKTSTARILAKTINCPTVKDATPCGACSTCQAIGEGKDIDVVEIDGASNNGVEQIRELRENVKFATAGSRYKIYIIDEVHMLSTAAFNALLKTLEEPPSHVKFIFATTEVHKVPETIRSRTQRFDFRLVRAGRIAQQLTYICEQEGINADEAALAQIAAAARGSFRDALTLLDQAAVYAPEGLDVASVTAVTGALSFENSLHIVKCLIAQDAKTTLEQIDAMIEHGVATDQIFGQLIELFRALMVLPEKPEGLESMFHYTPDQLEQVQAVSESFAQESAIYALQILNETRGQAKFYPEPRVALEMALVRCSKIGNIIALADLLAGKAELPDMSSIAAAPPAAPAPPRPAPSAPAPSAPTPAPAESAEPITPTAPKSPEAPEAAKTTKAKAPAKPVQPAPTPAAKASPPAAAPKVVAKKETPKVKVSLPSKDSAPAAEDMYKPQASWDAFIGDMTKSYPSFSMILKKASRKEDSQQLTITIPESMSFQVERLESRKDLVRSIMQKYYGSAWALTIQLDRSQKPENASAGSTPEAPSPKKSPPAPKPPANTAPAPKPPSTPAPSPTRQQPTPSASRGSDTPPWESRPMPQTTPSTTPSNRNADENLFAIASKDEDVQTVKDTFNSTIINIEKLPPKGDTP